MDFDLSEEQLAFREMARDWVDKNYPKARSRELEAREGQFPYELWKDLAAAGFHGIGIAEEYGGQGGDSITQSILARELARSLGGLAGVWGVSSFAGGKTLTRYGTAAQKQRFLPSLAQGDIRFSISITEPAGGTDLLGAMRSTVTRVAGGWRVNGQKVWTSEATAAGGELLIQECPGCGHRQHFPRGLCVRCGATPGWRAASGRGVIYSYTVVRQMGVPPFNEPVPYVVALIDLDEGPRLMGNVVDCEPEQVRIGAPVSAGMHRFSPQIAAPQRRLT
jgi:uncharacterized OB-fold protein